MDIEAEMFNACGPQEEEQRTQHLASAFDLQS